MFFGQCAKFTDFYLTHFIGQCLARPEDIAVNLSTNVVKRKGRINSHKINRLITCPAHGVHAGIHYQSQCTPHFIAQAAEITVGIIIHSHFQAKPFGVERPSLTVCRKSRYSSEFGQILQFLLQGSLQMMTRNGLVQRKCHHFIKRTAQQIVRIDRIKTGTGTIGGTAAVIGRGGAWCQVIRNFHDTVREPWQCFEQLRQLAVHFLEHKGCLFHQFFGGLGIELRIGSQEVDKSVEIISETGFGYNFHHLPANSLHLI